jgi:excisionase family DNA binding protein
MRHATIDKQPPEVLTLPEAAELLRVSERTVWELSARGELPHMRVGAQYRYLRSRLLAYLAGDEANV